MVFGSRNQRPQQPVSRLEAYANLVEQILTTIGYVPAQIRMPTNEGFGWSFRRGSAIIEIYVNQQPDNSGIMQVLSPIMHLPQSGLLPLYRRLLELNLQIPSLSLGVFLDVVYVYSERPLDGMDAAEADSIIRSVGNWADELDDKLVQEFGGRLYSRG
jgi:hypothetical protein